MANFSELLKDQKEKQDKETVAISEAAQSYSLQIQKEKGFGQSFIKGDKDNDPISNAAVSVIQNFQGELDTIADNDFTYLKDLIAKYNTFFEELPKSIDKERFTAKEGRYLAEVIRPTIEQLNEIAGPILRTKLAFRDLVKQFKPLKLAARTLGGIPILGTAITRKVERIEAGEQELRRAERRKGQEETRQARQSIEDDLSGFGADQPSAALEEQIEENQSTRRDIFADQPRAASVQKSAAKEENLEEQKAVQEDRYNEQKNLFEMIAENTYESKEILEQLLQAEEGIMDDLAEGVGGAAAVGGGAAAGVGGTKLASKFFGKKGADTAAKTATKKTTSKVLGKTLLKSAIKKIPIIGAIAGIGFGIGRLMSGDISGAAMEVASGAASTIPGAGTAASVGIDAALAAKDIKNAEKDIEGVVQTTEDVKTDNMKDFVNIDSKRTVVRTTLETDNLENILQKLLPENGSQNNTVVAPNNTIQNANTTNVLGKMTTKNIDNTVVQLKNVY
jgi:hypothetical protein